MTFPDLTKIPFIFRNAEKYLACKRCGAVQETPLDSVDPILAREARNLKFETQETSVEVKGLCWKCQNSANDSQ